MKTKNQMKKLKIRSKSKNIDHILCLGVCRLDKSSKVPMPNNMYTKPSDINSPHHFSTAGTHAKKVTFDPLPWSDFFDRKEMINGRVPIYIAGNKGHVFLCLHGAGNSALSFAAMASKMKSESTVVAFDFRGHGSSEESSSDLSQETLVNDTIEVVKWVHSVFPD
jgi:pimeloyl-ACP methyl ester carboxylesterase